MSTLRPTDRPLDKFTSSWGLLNDRVAELAGAENSSDKTKLLGISLKKLLQIHQQLLLTIKFQMQLQKEIYLWWL